jgi:hypothetical protein
MSKKDKKREVTYADVGIVPAVLAKWKCPACGVKASAFADQVAMLVHSGKEVALQCNECHKKYKVMKSVIETKAEGAMHGIKG